MSNTASCRCGHTGPNSTHPCHAKGYSCGKPAKQRFQYAGPAYVAGVMLKVAAIDTWACDDCWAAFTGGAKSHNSGV